MKEKITRELFDHLVELAALELDEGEAEYLRQELNNQLSAIAELEAITVDDSVPITAHGVPYTSDISQGLREDVQQQFKDASAILDGAPETEDGYFSVPDIPHEDLS